MQEGSVQDRERSQGQCQPQEHQGPVERRDRSGMGLCGFGAWTLVPHLIMTFFYTRILRLLERLWKRLQGLSVRIGRLGRQV